MAALTSPANSHLTHILLERKLQEVVHPLTLFLNVESVIRLPLSKYLKRLMFTRSFAETAIHLHVLTS